MTFKATDKVSSVLKKLSSGAESLTKKAWVVTVKVKDLLTAPIKNFQNSLYSIKTLVNAITAGLAVKKFVLNPISLADAYSSTKIGFSTLLGAEAGQQMMDAMDEFAKKTPFKTSGVIDNAQKMMAYGWDPERILTDMETIGNAAAATGKMDQGLESIVYALSEIRSKGKLSTQELNQLASAGIKAKAYLAEGLGYGTSDSGMQKLAKDLEKGVIGANQAIDLILEGMKEFDGMMDRTANETVEGLKSQLEDAFEINIFRRWGQGLQSGAKRGLGTIVTLLDDAEASLRKFGDYLYVIGYLASDWVADRMELALEKVTAIVDSDEFKNASMTQKVGLLWNGLVVDPLQEWWNGGGQQKTAETAGKIGSFLGTTMSKGLLAIFGATDVLNESDVLGNVDGEGAGASIANEFVRGFVDNFDGDAIKDAFVKAVSNIWDALPTWSKVALGVYAGGKAASFAGSAMHGASYIAGGVGSFIGSAGHVGAAGDWVAATGLRGAIGSAGASTVMGSGLLGGLASAGYGLTGGVAGSALSGGLAALAGGAGILGGIGGLVGAGKGLYDMFGSFKAYEAGDRTEGKAKLASGGTALGGVAAGAAIGSLLGPLGALVGAGVGGVGGLIGGSKWAQKIRNAKTDALEESALAEMEKAIQESVENGLDPKDIDLNQFFTITDDKMKAEVETAMRRMIYDVKSRMASAQVELDIGMYAGPSYRGGLYGLNVPGFADGGMVRGGSQLVTVAEEGTPEMIIPLGSQRRERGLRLWEKAGSMLGAPGFDEGIRFAGGYESSGSSGVQVDVGGVQVQINVSANGSQTISEAIRAQAGEIAETVAGIMADALGAQFENTPIRGGNA